MKKSILFNITFKFKEERIHLVEDVIINCLKYADEYDIKIILDTDIDCNIIFYPFNITNIVWKNLSHPFHLIYGHRKNFIDNINNFDYFFHLEDDIVFPKENFNEAIENFPYLWENNCVQSFATVENFNNKLTSVHITEDYKNQINREKIIVNNKLFVNLTHYHSPMWFIPQKILLELLKIAAIRKQYFIIDDSREDASSFIRMIGKLPVTLIENNKIDKKSYCYHISCNYSPNINIPYGKILIEDIYVSS